MLLKCGCVFVLYVILFKKERKKEIKGEKVRACSREGKRVWRSHHSSGGDKKKKKKKSPTSSCKRLWEIVAVGVKGLCSGVFP